MIEGELINCDLEAEVALLKFRRWCKDHPVQIFGLPRPAVRMRAGLDFGSIHIEDYASYQDEIQLPGDGRITCGRR